VPAKLTAFNNPALLAPQANPEGLPFGVDATLFKKLPVTFYRVDLIGLGARMLFFGAPLSPEATAPAPKAPAIYPAVYEMTMFDLGDGGAVVTGQLRLNK
jgi:hypothetical protein